MDFTREPIIETVITPKEGCKIVVRSSKSSGQEEYFVDAVEVVSFGNSVFFRSTERPKAFLVPVSDYEILEVREARMVLKNVGIDRAIKIGGGRDAQMRAPREQPQERQERAERPEKQDKGEKLEKAEAPTSEGSEAAPAPEAKQPEKKRDRRRQYRRRRGRDGAAVEEEDAEEEGKEVAGKIDLPAPRTVVEGQEVPVNPIPTPSVLTSLLPPPPTLISETIARYKDNALFRDAFYSRGEEKVEEVHIHESEAPQEGHQEVAGEMIPLAQPDYGSFEVSEQEEEEIYRQRKKQRAGAGENKQQGEAAQGEAVGEAGLTPASGAVESLENVPELSEAAPAAAPEAAEPVQPSADDEAPSEGSQPPEKE